MLQTSEAGLTATEPGRPPGDPRPGARRWVFAATRYGVGPYLAAADALAMAACSALSGDPIATGLTSIMIMAALQFGGLQRSRLAPSVLDDLWPIIGRVLLGGGIALVLLSWLGSPASVVDTVHALPALAGALVLERALVYAAVREARRHGLIGHPTLIVGSGLVAREIEDTLRRRPEHGLRPLGHVAEDSDARALPAQGHLGGTRDLSRIIIEQGAAVVVVAFVGDDRALVDIIRTCDRMQCEIFYVPRLYEVHSMRRDEESVRGIPLVRLDRPAFRTRAWRSKRALDLCVATLCLLICAPIMITCALAVRIETGRGVLFRQRRVGLDGREFSLLKFRSLNPSDAHDAATRWTVAGDRNVGPVGRFLRRSSLDELPQLFNILRGDMTLVGPRPERPHFVDVFSAEVPRYLHRCRVPAGLTGWAQVHGLRGDTPIDERVRFDNYYIENWSLWLDIKIMLRTIPQLVRGVGR